MPLIAFLPIDRHHPARQSRCRTSQWTPAAPTEWQPYDVYDRDGNSFTDAGCWFLIADLIEGGHPMYERRLEHPPGTKAYVMLVELNPGLGSTYIKIQLGSGKIIGRSFHISKF